MRTLFCILTITVLSLSSQAQDAIPVMDIQLQNELENQADDHMRQLVNLMLIRSSSHRAKEAVEGTRSLQEQYRHFLRQTTSTVDLAWMNSQAVPGQLEWVTAASGHLDDYGFARQLSQLYEAQVEPAQKSLLLYDWLVPLDDELVLTSLQAFRQDQRQRKLHYEALRQMQQRRQLQLARLKQSTVLQERRQAQQMGNGLLQNKRFSMTEAERLSLLGKAEESLLGIQKSQLGSDDLILKSQDYSFSKAFLLNRFNQYHLRQSVGITNLFPR
jgi:hypothetical protein